MMDFETWLLLDAVILMGVLLVLVYRIECAVKSLRLEEAEG